MDQDDHLFWSDALRQSREDLLQALQGVTAEGAASRPQPDRWSILEIVEHVALAENAMFLLITEQTQPAQPADTRDRERLIVAKGASRKRKFEAPPSMIPTGRFSSLHQAIAAFLESRARTEAFVASCIHDLRAVTVLHPVAGRITAAECLALLAVHPSRHALQIREILTA